MHAASLPKTLLLTSGSDSGINNIAAVAATRGDLGQLAPRKKLLKSFSSFLEDFLRPSEHFGAEGFSFPPCCPNRIPTCQNRGRAVLAAFVARAALIFERLLKRTFFMSTTALYELRCRECGKTLWNVPPPFFADCFSPPEVPYYY